MRGRICSVLKAWRANIKVAEGGGTRFNLPHGLVAEQPGAGPGHRIFSCNLFALKATKGLSANDAKPSHLKFGSNLTMVFY